MSRLLYWSGVALAAIGMAAAIWRLGPSQALFPGLMTLFSFYLIWITHSSRLRRENPKVLIHRGSIGLLSSDTGRKSVVCISNPGVLAGTLTKIDYRINGKPAPDVNWSWQYLHPQLTPRPNSIPRSDLPVPLLPGSLIALYTTKHPIDPVPKDAYLHLTFRMGDYKERSMKWRVEPLKSAAETGEDESRTS